MHENNKFCDIHNGNTILYNNNVENEKMDRMLQKCNLNKGFNYRYLTRKDNP